MPKFKVLFWGASFLALFTTSGWSKPLNPKSSENREKMISTMTFQDPSRLNNDGLVVPLSLDEMDRGPAVGDYEIYLRGPEIYCNHHPFVPGGTNPKFRGTLTSPDGKVINAKDGSPMDPYQMPNSYETVALKVKYKTPHPSVTQSLKEKDMYTEVFASEFLRSMGFAADYLFPSDKVICKGCSTDPFGQRQASSLESSVAEFPDASLEIAFPGTAVEMHPDQGFSFAEINRLKLSGKLSERTRIEFEGAAALANFLVHSSNVANQQRLVCPKDQVAPDTDQCTTPVIGVMQDLGSILGSQNPFLVMSSAKANLGRWKQYKIWQNKQTCTLNLRFGDVYRAMPGVRVSISEEGRQFIVSRLKTLIDDPTLEDLRLRKILRKSKFEKADSRLTGMSADGIIQAWTEAFKAKYDELASAKCPASPKPVSEETRKLLGF